jgi:glucokinase
MNYIGIDLGGTNLKGVLLDESGNVLFQKQIPTEDDGSGLWKQNVKKLVAILIENTAGQIAGIGISAPGLPDLENKVISFLPNRLIGLENFDWSAFLGYPSFVINDAHSALLAETSFGIAKGYKNVVLITLGTGVGGGILINGKLYQGLSQMAGHLGHISVDAQDDETSIVGMPGSLEYAIGNYSVKKRSMGKFETTYDLVEAFNKGDHWAALVWLNSIKKLAVAIASISNLLSPEMIVISGGISLANEALFEPLDTYLAIFEWRPGGKKTIIKQAQFGDIAGAMGAAGFLKEKMIN